MAELIGEPWDTDERTSEGAIKVIARDDAKEDITNEQEEWPGIRATPDHDPASTQPSRPQHYIDTNDTKHNTHTHSASAPTAKSYAHDLDARVVLGHVVEALSGFEASSVAEHAISSDAYREMVSQEELRSRLRALITQTKRLLRAMLPGLTILQRDDAEKLAQLLEEVRNFMQHSEADSVHFQGRDNSMFLPIRWISKVEDIITRLTEAQPLDQIFEDDEGKVERYPVVLCLDGGGVRSYFSLLVLEQLMGMINERQSSRKSQQKSHRAASSLKPSDVFDFMYGTSSGGLIAIMLGRLEMTVAQCKKNFVRYADELFGDGPSLLHLVPSLSYPRYSEKRIIEATRLLLDEFDPVSKADRWRRTIFASPNVRTKTAVIAYNQSTNSQHVFRSHDQTFKEHSANDRLNQVTAASPEYIWQVARAASAAPLYFAPMRMNGNTFFDGGMKANNPSMVALRELIGSDAEGIMLIISIGSGMKNNHNERKRGSFSIWRGFLTTVTDLLTDTQTTHEEVAKLIDHTEGHHKYHRLNESKSLGAIQLDEWTIKKSSKSDVPVERKTRDHIEHIFEEWSKQPDVKADLEASADDIVRLIDMKRRNLPVLRGSGSRLWKEIEGEIEAKLVKSEFEETPFEFLPEGELNMILKKFSQRTQYRGDLHLVISHLLLIHRPSIQEEELSLVDYILDENHPATKLFFIVLLAEHDRPYEAMMLWKEKLFCDANLPIQWPNQVAVKDFQDHPFALLDQGANPVWTNRAIKEFHTKQRLLLAPVLTTNPPEVPGNFGESTLPFIARDTQRSVGSFGVVCKYIIHPNHFNAGRKVEIPCVVAVKKLRKYPDDVARNWTREITASLRMNTLNQKHIVKFLTAFTRSTSKDNTANLENYLVFEWAEGGNLQDFWASFADSDRSVAFIKWTVRQLHGLSRALVAAHYLLDDDGIYRGASYSHGDIKPANILWFPGEGGDWGTLKICDWGEAENHDYATATTTTTMTRFGTKRYEPPEVLDWRYRLSTAAKVARSRLYDMWSMGCVMMEHVVWLVYGLQELRRFCQSCSGDHGVSEQFYEALDVGRAIRVAVHGAVTKWLAHMKNDPFCRPTETALGDILEIISGGLLVIQIPPEDLTSDEVRNFYQAHPAVPVDTVPSSLSHSESALSPPIRTNPVRTQSSAPHSPDTGHSNTRDTSARTHNPTSGQENLGSGDLLTMNATPTEDVHGPPSTKRVLQRYRATELVILLEKIVKADHNDKYWLASGSPAPAPPASSPGSMTPRRIVARCKFYGCAEWSATGTDVCVNHMDLE